MVDLAVSRYQSVRITTGSPGDLLMALYDGLFRFLKAAAICLRNKRRSEASTSISRAHAILTELYVSLDPRYAPDLCANLESLYGFCLERIVAANLRNDADQLDDVIRVLTPVRDAFREAVQQVHSNPGALEAASVEP